MKRFLTFIILLFWVNSAYSVALPWSTTFDCEDWNQDDGYYTNCDGIVKHGGWKALPGSGVPGDIHQNGYVEQITVDANYPGGAGGKGLRSWNGPGTNSTSGSIEVYIDPPLPQKIWVRWYQNWEVEHKGSPINMTKELYFWTSSPYQVVHEMNLPDGGGWGTVFVGGGEGHYYSEGGFNSWYPSGTSDGTWQCFEVHIDTVQDVYKYWHNDNLILDKTVVFPHEPTFESFNFQINSKNVDNSPITRPMHVNIDDVAVSKTGKIGCLGAPPTDTTPPTISVIYPIENDTLSGTEQFRVSASDNVGVTEVQYKINGAPFGDPVTTPFRISIDTTGFTDDDYYVSAIAKDAAGNETESDVVNFSIDNSQQTTVLLYEHCNDTDQELRGWYDNNTNQIVNTSDFAPVSGNVASCEYEFEEGQTVPIPGTSMRHLFTAVDEIYISYWIKYLSGWQGSNDNSHPHWFMILTNESDPEEGLSFNELTIYIEENEHESIIAIQDSANIDTNNINVDLTSTTENRAVAGCNGDSDGHGDGSCYPIGGGDYQNGKQWKSGNTDYSNGTWHFVEAHIKLNTISGGVGQADGIVKMWVDDVAVISHTDVMLRTNKYPDMLMNQINLAPFIGVGSPINQTALIDEIYIRTQSSGDPPPPPPPPTGDESFIGASIN